MSLTIRHVPDPVLRAICDAVTVFDADLAQLADDMFTPMYAAMGRGLAAPQVGVTRRIFVMDATWKDAEPSPMVFVNPVILTSSDDEEAGEEGCLSIPDTPCTVTRPVAVTLRWQDLQGAAQEQLFDGFVGRCVQHERDHLDGILCMDYQI